jgi:hypothetical protein
MLNIRSAPVKIIIKNSRKSSQKIAIAVILTVKYEVFVLGSQESGESGDHAKSGYTSSL